jgi:hypothetical protein
MLLICKQAMREIRYPVSNIRKLVASRKNLPMRSHHDFPQRVIKQCDRKATPQEYRNSPQLQKLSA